MKQRLILVAVIGYILGILWGLYFTFSIVFCYIAILATYYMLKKFFKLQKKSDFKLLSFNRYRRYLKLFINAKVVFIFLFFSVLSNGIVLFQDNQYEHFYQDGEMIEITGIIVCQKIEKPYYDLYQVKVLDSKNFNLSIQVSKKNKELEYGDQVKLEGVYKKPSQQRNYGGYDDSQYLKTLKIAGRVKVNQIEVIAKKQLNVILQYANSISLKAKEKIETIFDEKRASILKGLLLGQTGDIEDEVKENFQISNISHVLAISGMHISYIILGLQIMLKKTMGNKHTKIMTIFILIMYAFITGFSPSMVRAVVMGVITIGSGLVYRKSDVWNSIAISLLGILWYNPFLILNVGLQLSYLGTIGIILFQPTILRIFHTKSSKKNGKMIQKGKEVIAVSLSAQVMILPILLYHFNTMGIYFLVTNLLVSLVIGCIIILGFFCILLSFVCSFIANFLVIPLGIALDFLNGISRFSELPFSKIYIPTLNWFSMALYFMGILIGNPIYAIYHGDNLMPTHKRVKNIIALLQYKFRLKKKKYLICVVTVFLVFTGIYFSPKEVRIYFVDVGQGDCTLLVTPQNKTILLDGGGSLTDFDVGKKTVIPYLMDRGFTSIDYVFISHYDTDHVRTDC